MNIVMKRLALVPLLVLALACPGDKRKDTAQLRTDSVKTDTAAPTAATTDTTPLSGIKANLPPAPTATPPAKTASTGSVRGGNLTPIRTSFPDAPTQLVDAVQREQSATRFCFTEFGQKADPSLRGNVAMLVTISNSGVSDARVGDSRWTGVAGRAVNRCLDQKAKQAWNVAPGSVKPGRYVVQLSFSGTQ
jgi:hypothetical protein